jgi:hypothetical protein
MAAATTSSTSTPSSLSGDIDANTTPAMTRARPAATAGARVPPNASDHATDTAP